MTPQPTDPIRGGLPSASSLDRVINCPGSVAAERNLPQLAEETFTADGTDIHAALETGDLSKLSSDNIQIAEKLIALTADAVRIWHEEKQLGPENTSIAREQRLWIHNKRTLDPIASAQLDVLHINGEHALVVDYKTGFLGAPPAYVNAQLRTQAVALRHEHDGVKVVRVAIAHARFKPTFDFCDYTETDLHAAENEIIVALWKAAQPNAPRFAGTWCKYCRAQADCREAASLALLPTAMVPVKPPFKDVAALVSQLSLQDLAAIQSRKGIAEKIFDAVTDRLKLMSADELATIGYELKPNRPTREIKSVKELFGILSAEKYCTSDEFLAWCKIGIGEMEDVVSRKIAEGNKITIKDAKGIVASVIEPVVTLNPKAPTLALIK